MQLKDLLCNHRPKVLPCVTLVFGGKGVKIAWIYINCPWRAHDLDQLDLELGLLGLETITYCDYQSVLHSLRTEVMADDCVWIEQNRHTVLAHCER